MSKEPRVLTRWKRRKRERPLEILQAALGEFSGRGFAAVRMSDIARRAGVTKGTLYLYFANKRQLFDCVRFGLPDPVPRLGYLGGGKETGKSTTAGP